MKNKRIILSIIWIVLGGLLWGLSLSGRVDDYWGTFGFALAMVGVLQLLRRHRISKNPEWKEKIEIAEKDERNHFIRCKAWAWAGYLFILIVSLATIVLRLMGQELLSVAAAYAICLMVFLYWGAYWLLQKKY